MYQWPNDGRDTRFAYAMLVPAAVDEGFEECWVRQWPVSDQTDGLLYSTLTVRDTDGSSTAGVTQLNKAYDARWDPAAAYGSRLTRWTPLAGLAVGMLIGVLSVRRRRLEYAGALHSGQAKADQLLGIGVETLIWAMPATIAALSLLAAAAVRLAADPAGVFLTAARTPLAVFAGVLFASLAAGLTIRENQLFRYFKHR